jgi:RimJ/RimL family protein N-acetyltransferase
VLTTIRLRDVLEADLPIFFAQQCDPAATAMAEFPARDRDAFMAHWARVLRDPAVTTQTVLADGQVAGNVVCFIQDEQPHVGYWLGRPFWGRGIATAALAAFLAQVPTRPLFAAVAPRNIASRRVLEKCGFRQASATDEEVVLILEAGGSGFAP